MSAIFEPRAASREPRVAWAGESLSRPRYSRLAALPLEGEYRPRGIAVRPARILEQKRDCSQSRVYRAHRVCRLYRAHQVYRVFNGQ